MNDSKQRFLSLISEYVKRDGVDALTAWLSKSDFFVAPASTRFHGSYAGGLVEHSLNVFDCLCKAIENHRLQEKYSQETVAVSSLLHDVCKVNLYKKGFRNVKDGGQWVQKETYEIEEQFPCGDHADKSVIILQNFIRLEPEEILAIRGHMGGWDNAVKGGAYFISKIFERSPLAVLLHLSDMEATYLLEQRKGE
jgi:hypothetical protein